MHPCSLLVIVTLLVINEKASCFKQQRVLLMSFDGFRYDYIDKYNMINFKRIVSGGVRAKFLKPQFSTQTYPNHWSIVTGLYEESHGIVGNTFYDPRYGEIFIRNDTNLKWWNASEPIWFTIAKSNLRSGTYFWPGSEVIYSDTPYYSYLKYDEKLELNPKIDKVVEWFTKEDFKFATIYDPQPDYNGHFFGLDSQIFNDTIVQLDQSIGYLIEKLEESKLYNADDFNLIIVSDHGMSNTNTIVVLDDYITTNDCTVLSTGGNNVHLKILPGSNITALLEKLYKIPGISVFLKENIPDNWHFKNNRRVGDILLVAKEGTGLYCYLNTPNATRNFYLADHGYDKNVTNVQANFVAKGALFKRNYSSENSFENVDVYPLICYIMNIKCLKNNGTLATVEEFLVERNGCGRKLEFKLLIVLDLIILLVFKLI